MKKVVVILALISLFIACNSDDDTTPDKLYTYPTRLTAQDYKVLGDVKIYTKNGLVTNQQAINKIRASTFGNNFYWDNYSNVPLIYTDTITYQNIDTLIMPKYGSSFWSKRVIKKENGYNYFYMKDTVTIYKPSIGNSPLQIIINNIGIFKPFHKDVTYSDAVEYYFDADIAKGNASQLEFPMLIYRLTRTTSNGNWGAAVSGYNNAFDKNVLALLQDGDTLTVQETKIIYRNIDGQ